MKFEHVEEKFPQLTEKSLNIAIIKNITSGEEIFTQLTEKKRINISNIKQKSSKWIQTRMHFCKNCAYGNIESLIEKQFETVKNIFTQLTKNVSVQNAPEGFTRR